MTLGIVRKSRKLPYMYRAKVEENNDPLMYGRIQARIYPMFADEQAIPTEYLPWAVPAMPIFDGAGFTESGASGYSGYSGSFGCTAIPKIGTFVFVFFEAGDPYQPVYFAEAQTATYGVNVPLNDEDYPFRKMWKTKNGIQITVNDSNETEDHRDILVSHPSGSWAEFYPDGRITLHTTGTSGVMLLETDVANINVLAKKGDINVTASEGNITATASKKDINVIASKGSIFVTADVGVTVTAKNIKLDAPVTQTSKVFEVGTAPSGSFTDANGNTIVVSKGIITTLN